MQRLAFFGASVTAQKEGYVAVFQELTKEMDVIVFRHAYSGMHLSDAGICFIDTALKDNPNYLFIEWFSTGQNYHGPTLSNYLDALVRKCVLQNCTPIFLLLDRDPILEKKRLMYDEIISYADQYKIYYIKLYDNVNIKDLLKDWVHTNSKGSDLYGNRIFEEFCKIVKNPQITYEIPEHNKYCNILFKDLDITVDANIIIEGSFQLIGIYQDVGLFSGLIMKDVDSKIRKEDIWDMYCHYTRKTIKINTDSECKNVKINVLQENFDTSTCRREYDFTNIKRYLRIYKIFYIGNISSIEVDNNIIAL